MSSWHVDPDALRDYAEGTADRAVSWSIETHLPVCADCREVLSRLITDADRDLLTAARAGLRLSPPARSSRLPVPVAGLLGSVWSWLLVVGALAGLLLIAGRLPVATAPGAAGLTWLLVLSPLVPVGMVAAVYALADPDPTVASTPRGGLELVLRRTALAITLAVPVVLLGQAGHDVETVGWVLPALGLCLGALALGSWIGVERASLALGAGWLLVVVVAMSPVRGDADGLARLLVPSGPAMAGWLAAIAVVTVVVVARRDRFDLPGVRA